MARFQGGLEGSGAEIRGFDFGELAVKASNGGALGRNDVSRRHAAKVRLSRRDLAVVACVGGAKCRC